MSVAPHARSGGQTDDCEADIEGTGRGDLTVVRIAPAAGLGWQVTNLLHTVIYNFD